MLTILSIISKNSWDNIFSSKTRYHHWPSVKFHLLSSLGAGKLCSAGRGLRWTGFSYWRWGRLWRVPFCDCSPWRWGHSRRHNTRDRWYTCVRDDTRWRQRSPELLSSSNQNQDSSARWVMMLLTGVGSGHLVFLLITLMTSFSIYMFVRVVFVQRPQVVP